jgi:hypothetical protein
MNEKFSVYDLFATLVSGTLVIGLIAVLVPDLATQFKSLNLPDAFAVIVLTALAIFAGNVVNATASLLDGPLFFSWLWQRKIRPSEYCLQHGLGSYMPASSATRIKGKLAAVVGAGAGDRDLFLYAMQQAEAAPSQRVTIFNALFAYHRALFMLAAIAVAVSVALVCGYGPAAWSTGLRWGILVSSLLMLVLLWHRTKQRAYYYVREILHTAERVLDARPAAQPAAVAGAAAVPPVNQAQAPVQVGNGVITGSGGN